MHEKRKKEERVENEKEFYVCVCMSLYVARYFSFFFNMYTPILSDRMAGRASVPPSSGFASRVLCTRRTRLFLTCFAFNGVCAFVCVCVFCEVCLSCF